MSCQYYYRLYFGWTRAIKKENKEDITRMFEMLTTHRENCDECKTEIAALWIKKSEQEEVSYERV